MRENTVQQQGTASSSWQSEQSIDREALLWAVGSLCQVHKIPFEPQLLLHHYPPPHTLTSLLGACQHVGLELRYAKLTSEGIPTFQLPCIAILKQDDAANESEDEAPETIKLALIARIDDGRILWFKAGSDTPQLESTEEFLDKIEPTVLSAWPEQLAEEDDNDEPQKFGFRWFVPEIIKHKKLWRDVLLASLAIQLFALATPLFTQVVIDKVIVHHAMNTLYVIGFGLLMFMLFSSALTWIRQYLVIHTGNRIDAVLGSKVFSHLFHLPIRYFENRPTGTLVARIQGIETIREFVSGAAVSLLLDLPFLFIFLAVMFYYSWQLTVIVLVCLTLITIISLVITPLLRHRLNEQFMRGAKNQAFLTEYLSGVETVKSLQMEPQLNHQYGDLLAAYLKAGFKTRTLSNTYNVSAQTIEQVQTLAILAVGAWLVMTTDGFTIGMLVAFQMFASRLSQPVMRIVGLWQEFQQANIAVKRLGDIMDAPTEPYALIPARTQTGEGKIEIQSLAFRYGEDRPYLYRDLKTTIPAGSSVAILGSSGSGKSTLTKLLQGFYQPTEGRILIDGRDIRHLSANELRRYFGVVPQESVLFAGTIYENLILANPYATFEQVAYACKMAEIHEVIEELPQGYQTEIGEHGTGLSGGQKQRMAIARALLKRPKVLIFDEAIAHLDSETSEQFANTVNQLKGKVTVLFITHQMPDKLRVDCHITLESFAK
ncbi:MAG: peptidase domain-containing ABC transporter [Gammaproteobacteria bacterium]|nr:peptidase domain-containing ABC transporter [Gammaproteobacteria bacterium]